MQLRIEKSIARLLAVKLAPECGEVLSLYRAKRDGWIKMPAEFELIRKNSGLGDLYVVAYEEESRILSCLIKSLFPGEAIKEFKQFNDELVQLSESEKLDFMDLCVSDFLEDDSSHFFESIFQATEDEREDARKRFEAMPEDEKKSAFTTVQLLFTFIYSYFYNHIALMVHGQKLTTLVPLALQGDKKAFCKAIQIDRNILTSHPYFRDTYNRLQTGEDPNFLDDIASYIKRPPIRGRIRFPALYMLFAILDGFRHLEDFTASEILDICDNAMLDRYQNRIADECSVNKKRIEYLSTERIRKLDFSQRTENNFLVHSDSPS